MKRVPIESIFLNNENPRKIKGKKLDQLIKSVVSFPEMLEKRPIVVDENMVILGGNMRLQACKEAGLTEVPVVVAEDWTEEQKQEFIIKDNIAFGDWDWDVLNVDWDVRNLEEWGLECDCLGDWHSDIDAVDRIEENLDGIMAKIKIECEQEQKDDVLEAIQEALAGMNGVKIA